MAARWFYLSPHLDDVVFSCGGLVWEQINSGDPVIICTLCAGDPPPGPLSDFALGLHIRWGSDPDAAVSARRLEDGKACRVLGASPVHLEFADCIYRRLNGNPMVASVDDLFSRELPPEPDLVKNVADRLASLLAPDDLLICPLAVGGHIDHRLTRLAAESLGRPMLYYSDFPYAANTTRTDEPTVKSMSFDTLTISASGLQKWQQAAAAYRSQISSFWKDLPAMRAAIQKYSRGPNSLGFWRCS